MGTIIAWTIIIASEILAAFLLRKIWRSGSHLVEKIALSILAVIPVLGPLFASWLILDPGPAHPAFRDRRWARTDVLDRWKHVFDEKDPVERQKSGSRSWTKTRTVRSNNSFKPTPLRGAA